MTDATTRILRGFKLEMVRVMKERGPNFQPMLKIRSHQPRSGMRA